jgi:hypothetical protein
MFHLPRIELIPEWFEYDYSELSISFWFRKKLPSIALCFTSAEINFEFNEKLNYTLILIINGCEYYDHPINEFLIEPGHTYLYHIKLQDMVKFDAVILKHEWNHAKLTSEDSELKLRLKEGRLHIFDQESSMEDFQFTNPYKERELHDGIDNVNGDVFYDVDDVLEDDGDVFYDVDEEDDDNDNFVNTTLDFIHSIVHLGI